jgi:hypothetical protein
MVQGAIVGRTSAALSCFVGALYAAQVRRTTDGSDPYRFACSTEALAVVNGLYNALKAGEWPLALEPQALARVAFSMDFPNALGKRLLPAFGRAKQQRDAPELELGVRPLAAGPGGGPPVLADVPGPALLDSRVLVFLAEIPSIDAAGALDVDTAFAHALFEAERAKPMATVVWWLPAPPTNPKPKDDQAKAPAIPGAGDRSARHALSAALMARHLPSTAARLAAAKKDAPSFFAWVTPEKIGNVVRVKRRQLFDVGGVEPEYPFEEFLSLLDHLGAIAS